VFQLFERTVFLGSFFMTIYVFLSFNFLNPGKVNIIFKDRILDTAIAGIIAFAVSYMCSACLGTYPKSWI
jgi:hypothetical protein